MPALRSLCDIRLVNGSCGDPVLFCDYPGKNDAYLFDAGELGNLEMARLADLQVLCLTHHHMDHMVGFDRLLRANLDHDKVLHIFGPEGTIRRLYQRITSYEYRYFPFMKIVFEVHDVLPGRMDTALLECARKFPEPAPVPKKWKGPMVFENDDVKVEAAFAEHTAPCLAYALVEKPSYQLDPAKLAAGSLKPGPWIRETLDRLRRQEGPQTTLEIQGGQYRLGPLTDQYFSQAKGARVTFVTDTLWSGEVRPGLVKLAQRAQRLYCDSYFANAQLKQAREHKHMTNVHAAELAREAKVEELILMHFGTRYAGKYEALVEEAREIFPNVRAEL